jgi:hypothetical protein
MSTGGNLAMLIPLFRYPGSRHDTENAMQQNERLLLRFNVDVHLQVLRHLQSLYHRYYSIRLEPPRLSRRLHSFTDSANQKDVFVRPFADTITK